MRAYRPTKKERRTMALAITAGAIRTAIRDLKYDQSNADEAIAHALRWAAEQLNATPI